MTVAATQRDPLAFEYVPSSSALAVLSRSYTQPPLSMAVSSLIAQASQTAVVEDNSNNGFVDINDLIDLELRQLTTTQLGIERLEDAFDTYLLSTLPLWLYQSNLFA